MIIPHQILDWANELNNKRSNETTRLNYLQKLEEVNTYISSEIAAAGYGNKRNNRKRNTA
tara:strand:- start:17146 stop:17325 length:180 start_codon:yes stop_codon:yes gene_type:complete